MSNSVLNHSIAGSAAPHIPVLLKEVLEQLNPEAGKTYLDCTFGAGGYSRAILENSDSQVVALDQDPSVQLYAKALEADYGNRFKFIHSSFAESAKQLQGQLFDGIVMDLGVSSMQLDCGERGFSFMQDGPLDMRMSSNGISAADFVNSAEEEEIANVIYRYGDETASRKIARRIVAERSVEPITTTARLASIVRSCIGFKKGKIDSATKSFQAIRIHINDELGQLEKFLENSVKLLAPQGRLVIVSFHSLEDSIIKNFFKSNSEARRARSKYSLKSEPREEGKWLEILTKKPITPSEKELRLNPRSRSAKLRAALKVAEIGG